MIITFDFGGEDCDVVKLNEIVGSFFPMFSTSLSFPAAFTFKLYFFVASPFMFSWKNLWKVLIYGWSNLSVLDETIYFADNSVTILF